jgi:lysophospholipase L1-like esterase
MASFIVDEFDNLKRPIALKITASSHGTVYHGLPEVFSDIMKDQSRYQAPVFDAKGGRKIDSGIVDVIKEAMTSRSGTPQVHVLILGTNNIRRGESPQLVLHYFSQVIQHCVTIPKAHVVLVSLLPSPQTDTTTKALFREANKMLAGLAKEDPSKASFLNIATFFTIRGNIKEELFGDGIHFTPQGATLYSRKLANHLRKLPKSIFE